MKERPILMSAPMVRAILAGRKTQTRRPLKPQPVQKRAADGSLFWHWSARGGFVNSEGATWPMLMTHHGRDQDGNVYQSRCPYGAPGDRLWVRETWARTTGIDDAPLGTVVYRADIDAEDWAEERAVRQTMRSASPWKSSIHMSRWASRITLEVTAVRVERLQDISEEDAKAEGVATYDCLGAEQRVPGPGFDGALLKDQPHRLPFADLWDEINGEGSWDANPWVWKIQFERRSP